LKKLMLKRFQNKKKLSLNRVSIIIEETSF